VVDFKLPDVGEGLTEAEIAIWHVSVGDTIEVNDVLVEIETAKSVVELPSPTAGTVRAIHIEAGTTVEVGTVLISIQTSDDASTPEQPPGQPPTQAPTQAPTQEPTQASIQAPEQTASDVASAAEPAAEDKPLVLVGTGPAAPAGRRRRLVPPGERAQASPPVRLLAKQVGVDLETVAPSSGAIISRADVERVAARGPSNANIPQNPAGPETRTPVKGVRKATAEAMVTSAFTAPHASEWLEVDVTATMELATRLRGDRTWDGVRINLLVFVARAFLLTIRDHPEINARWDEAAAEIVVHHYVNLGIAAATPRGLLVPNIKDAHELDFPGLAAQIEQLVATARSGRTQLSAMAGGTVTITNIGALGVDGGTPILNPGEAAILAVGAMRDRAWVVEGEIAPRKVAQLAISFDHRLVDGELASLVLTDLARLLADPAQAFVRL
jgi:2-oxoisovalerate dehydrogenase E2 component (dihydrolipoyl transacylase)